MQQIGTSATVLTEHEKYAQIRATIGSQHEAAKLLGITRTALWRRENGSSRITAEAWIAIRSLAKDAVERKNVAEGNAKRDALFAILAKS